MKLAVSNIAWAPEEEAEVATTLTKIGVTNLEIAPTKVFADPLTATADEIRAYGGFWSERGISIVAFQSLLFGRPDLQVFGDQETRSATIGRLKGFIELAARLGVGKLVFGSPKNRRIPENMRQQEAFDIAVDVFSQLGTHAQLNGTCLCIEPNPTEYGCNFVTTTAEGIRLVSTVANSGFGLHLDSAGMSLAGDLPNASLLSAREWLQHYHVSAPGLAEIESEVVDHRAAADALRIIDYRGYVSIEMRAGHEGDSSVRVENAVELTRSQYWA